MSRRLLKGGRTLEHLRDPWMLCFAVHSRLRHRLEVFFACLCQIRLSALRCWRSGRHRTPEKAAIHGKQPALENCVGLGPVAVVNHLVVPVVADRHIPVDGTWNWAGHGQATTRRDLKVVRLRQWLPGAPRATAIVGVSATCCESHRHTAGQQRRGHHSGDCASEVHRGAFLPILAACPCLADSG
jgi:hypothetical protein